MAFTKEKLEGDRRTSAVSTPPEGGWGWMIVTGCFLATICIRAVTRCISMFFVEFQMQFEKDYSSTAWIHSLVDSTTMLCAPLGGFLGNRLSCRATVIIGGLLSAAGLVLSSYATSLEYLYIFLGILTGLGFALSYTPTVAMVGKYFSERKTLAYGIALSGSGTGTFILAPVIQLLIEHYSWRGALLILGGFVSNLCVCGALMRPLEPKGDRELWENSLTDLEKNCMTTALDFENSEQVPGDCGQLERKQLEINNLKDTQALLIANGALKNFRLENDKLGPGNIALLSSPSLPSLRFTDLKIAECILFSNKLTESMLRGIKRSDLKLANDNMTEDLKLVESMNLNNKLTEMEVKIKDSGFTEAKPTDVYHLVETVSPPSEPLVNTKTISRGHCLNSRGEFGFLLIPDFLILLVSFLFLAFGCGAPVVYLVPYALSVGVKHQNAAFLMSMFGISGIVGNVTFGWITDRKCLKRYRMLSYMVAISMEGLCCMLMPLLQSFSLLVPFSILYGYFDGAYVALIPVVTSDIVGSSCLTSALGVVYFLHAIPYLVTPPIGGWLVDRTGNYAATFFLSGASFMFSSVVLAATTLVRQCWRSKSDSAAHLGPNHIAAAAAQQGII
ncbi:monocarboxylate transporter 12-B-like [Mastacembelus armatus]|uniref:monocarboxylate transporter 12-B-like n=1 Tax=Mastacembelus armatus TaxID=205130 RepID=UPI000E462227|nr:monocarboxylate transporter 12-B-like [Mastacembelus armatus]